MAETLDPLHLPLHGSRLIEASAGTGKTWTISALYLRLVLGHGEVATGAGPAPPLRPAQILVMTFTRAATRELCDRIRARLVEAARCFRGESAPTPGDGLLAALLAAYTAGPDRENAAWRLALAAESMDEAAIHTIDAWCQRMLHEHAFDSASPFDEQLGADETALVAEAARDYWRAQVYPLDSAALDAVLALWPDVDHLCADVSGLLPHVPAETNTGTLPTLGDTWQQGQQQNAAAIARLKQGWPGRITTLRRWLQARLHDAADPAGPFNRLKLRADHVANWFDALAIWADAPDPVLPDLTAAAYARLSPAGLQDASKSAAPLDLPADFAALQALLADLRQLPPPTDAMRLHAAHGVARRVQMLKSRSGIYGFADLVLRLDAALSGPNGDALRQRIVQQYPMALVDEFQDTSPAQFRIFDRIYRTAANDRSTALLLIGDPKQSIYAFRGADIRSYLAARALTAGRHYRLGMNFRSSADLVAAVNGLFEGAELRQGPGAFRFRPVGAAQADNPLPFEPVLAHGRPERLIATNPATNPQPPGARVPLPVLTLCHDPRLLSAPDAMRLFAQRCAEHIVGLLNDDRAGFAHPTDGFAPLKPADIAVLVRTGREAQAVRQALRARRVASVYLSDRDSVLQTPEASDLLLWLKAVADPLDSRATRAALATATVGLPLAELLRIAQDDAVFEQRSELLRQLNRIWFRQGVLAMLRQMLHRLGLPARWLLQADGERRLTNVLHLSELLQTAAARLDGEQALIRWLARQISAPAGAAQDGDERVLRLESDADLVKVVTVHKSKGLEYPVVCLPFASHFRGAESNRRGFAVRPGADGNPQLDFRRSPALQAAADEERLQEDLRLLYVALTRARHALWVGVAALKRGNSEACVFQRSALGRLLAGEAPASPAAVAGLLHQTWDGCPGVVLQITPGATSAAVQATLLRTRQVAPALQDMPVYRGQFERDWRIGSFSGLVRDLSAAPLSIVGKTLSPAAAQELLDLPAEADAPRPAPLGAARHRFPRGALAGNFLHDQLQWLAEQGFALHGDERQAQALRQRCQRQGWGHHADDVVQWLGQVASTPLPPVGVALQGLSRMLPEMEFWYPSQHLAAPLLDALCQQHLLAGRPRPALPQRALHGLLMGFADLVFEQGGRYWVLDYKSNALGDTDASYHPQALEAAMAEHRYDVQAALYLLALHRLLRQRLGAAYRPAQQLGGAVYLFLRGIHGPAAGCYHVKPPLDLLHALDLALQGDAPATGLGGVGGVG